jgi:hypothetical protein
MNARKGGGGERERERERKETLPVAVVIIICTKITCIFRRDINMYR